ncbi:hypothetical protein K4L44_11760 [Halosquirtibacter laminarini]|uniref:Uncharacterized protein n=1 Tax=Halosquirtibacter laminarini TaxID=3374600 RepID=A0AC61NGA6_9BACT|nr:hypothetical protein K4L44_11760 [Prolixibacteraceae bacterium]
MNKLSFFSFLMFAALIVSSCSSSKKVVSSSEEEVLITTYCSGDEYRSTDKLIRASSLGESTDQVMSKRMARTNTLEELASKIEVSFKSVVDNYYSSKSTVNAEEVQRRYEGLSREVINQKISGYRTICEKVTKTKKGTYKTYLCFEIGMDDLLNPIYDKMSNDDKLRLDYDYEKFKKTFEKELKNSER